MLKTLIFLFLFQMEPEHAQKGEAGVQESVDVLADYLPRVFEHVCLSH
jgi:hypothetical protein